MDERIQQKSLAEHIVDDLEQKIVSGVHKPGQRIVEEALCSTYGVSRSPVREALRLLENQGFVVREPRRGISVARITPREAENIYRIRACLEGLAMSLAVQHQTPELLKTLNDLHQQMIRAAKKKTRGPYHKLNQKFHELIINACDNPRLIQLIRNFDRQTVRYRLAVTQTPRWMDTSTEIHAELVAAFEAGDADAAEQIRRQAVLRQIEQFPEIFTHEEQP